MGVTPFSFPFTNIIYSLTRTSNGFRVTAESQDARAGRMKLPRACSMKMPRACPVELHVCRYRVAILKGWRCHGLAPWSSHVRCYLASNVSLHGTRPWHRVSLSKGLSVATNVTFHGT